MKLLDAYVAMQNGELTEAEVASALGITERALKIRISRHGLKLPLVLSILDQFHENKISRDQAAAAMGVTVRTVNALALSWNALRPLSNDTITRATSQVKWEVRKKFALDFIRGTMNIDAAAEAAGVSSRQMRRWVANLIKKHYGIVYKDLAEIAPRRLAEMAKHIEEEEALEEATKAIADKVSEGLVSEREEAKRRLAAKRVARLKRIV